MADNNKHFSTTDRLAAAINRALYARRLSGTCATSFAAFGFGIWLVTSSQIASAATFHVSNNNDAGPGSLRNALTLANNSLGADKILFASNVTGSIALSSGGLHIADAVDVVGPGANKLSLDGMGQSVLSIQSDIGERIAVSITGLTLTNGDDGIHFRQGLSDAVLELVLSDTKISGNAGDGIDADIYDNSLDPGYGGQIITVENSVISGNGGSGIVSVSSYLALGPLAHLTVSGTEISGNAGEAINSLANALNIHDAVISGNGSGINASGSRYLFPDVSVTDSTISGNSGFGIGISQSRARIIRSTFSDNDGTGFSHSESTVVMQDSLVSGNGDGGIVARHYSFSPGALELFNSTVSGNHNRPGIGFDASGSLHIRQSTIANNSAGGIIQPPQYFYPTIVEGSIIAGNGGNGTVDLSGEFEITYSLVQNPGDATFPASPTNLINADPLLGPLADNGGRTMTHALSPFSPAIDGGDPQFAAGPYYDLLDGRDVDYSDQRGLPFARLAGSRNDMGAFEYQGNGTSGPGWIISDGDMDRDGRADLVSVLLRDGVTEASLHDVQSGARISAFSYRQGIEPVDVALLRPRGKWETPRLAVLDRDTPQVAIRNLLTGAMMKTISFSANMKPEEIVVLNNGVPGKAPLIAALDPERAHIEVRNAATGKLIRHLWYPMNVGPQRRSMLNLGDLNDNGSDDVGILLTGSKIHSDQLFIKDSANNEFVTSVFNPENRNRSFEALVLADRPGDLAPEIAFFSHRYVGEEEMIAVADVSDGSPLLTIENFNGDFDRIRFTAVTDITGDGIEEFALLGLGHSRQQVAAEIRDGGLGDAIRTVWFTNQCVPLDIESVKDSNGNGAAELALLGICGANATPKVVIKDAKTGKLVRQISL